MLGALYPAYTGLTAFAAQIAVTAHNLANVNTTGFKKSRTELVAVETGGVIPVVQKDKSTGPSILKHTGADAAQLELSNVDLGEETVNQILAQRGFSANIRTLHTADDMLGTILDIKK